MLGVLALDERLGLSAEGRDVAVSFDLDHTCGVSSGGVDRGWWRTENNNKRSPRRTFDLGSFSGTWDVAIVPAHKPSPRW